MPNRIVKYLKDQGYETIDSTFYRAIQMWDAWHQGYVKSFHKYSIYSGQKHINRTRATLAMAKKVTEDMANLLMNEKVEIVLDDASAQKFLEGVFKDNNFWVKINESQENKSALGTVAYVPYLEGATLKNNEVTGGKIKINYVNADSIFPLSWQNGHVDECAFSTKYSVGKDKYTMLQMHRLENGLYVIENKLFKTKNGKFEEVNLQAVDRFKNVASIVKTGSAKRQFVIDRLNIANNFDKRNPLGIALYANSIDVLKGLDLTYDSYQNEFILGRKRIFVRPEMMTLDNDVQGFDPDDAVFYMLPEDSAKDTFLKESNLALRSDEHSKALNDNLNLLSTKIGFGEEYYKFERGSIVTATQVISENSTLFRTIVKHEVILDSVLRELICIILELGAKHLSLAKVEPKKGEAATEGDGINIDFDDSIIEDTEAEFKRDMLLTQARIMRDDEMRAKYMNENIEDAKKNLPEAFESEGEE